MARGPLPLSGQNEEESIWIKVRERPCRYWCMYLECMRIGLDDVGAESVGTFGVRDA